MSKKSFELFLKSLSDADFKRIYGPMCREIDRNLEGVSMQMRRRIVKDVIDKGKTKKQVAKATGLPIEHVELIVARGEGRRDGMVERMKVVK